MVASYMRYRCLAAGSSIVFESSLSQPHIIATTLFHWIWCSDSIVNPCLAAIVRKLICNFYFKILRSIVTHENDIRMMLKETRAWLIIGFFLLWFMSYSIPSTLFESFIKWRAYESSTLHPGHLVYADPTGNIFRSLFRLISNQPEVLADKQDYEK